MASDLIPTITSAALGPKSFREDNTEAVSQPIGEIIKADQYAKAAAITSGLPFRTVKLKPGNNADIDVCGGNY